MFAQRILARRAIAQLPKVQARYFGGEISDPAEAAKGMNLWKWVSLASTAGVLVYGAFVLSDHEEGYRTDRPYTQIRNHRFPWSDGQRELFGIVGNKFGIYYPQYEAYGVDQGVEPPKDKHHH